MNNRSYVDMKVLSFWTPMTSSQTQNGYESQPGRGSPGCRHAGLHSLRSLWKGTNLAVMLTEADEADCLGPPPRDKSRNRKM